MVLELIQTYPRISILVIAALVSFFITLINYFVLDKEKMRAFKAKQKELNKKIKEHKHDPNKAMEYQKEVMQLTMENMKHSFKPMLFTFIPIIVVFGWVRSAFAETAISGSWLWYYIIGAIIFSIIFRKIFKLP